MGVKLYTVDNEGVADGSVRNRAPRKVSEFKAAVVHGTGSPEQKIRNTLNYMINQSGFLYHYIVGYEGEIYRLTRIPYRTLHVGSTLYTEDAIKKYSPYCPPGDHNVNPHRNSPNNCTFGVCAAILDHKWNMTEATKSSLATVLAMGIIESGGVIDPMNNIEYHSFFTPLKTYCHKYYIDNPREFTKLKSLVKSILNSNRKLEDLYDDCGTMTI